MNLRILRLSAPLVALILALFLISCGGDDSDRGTTTAASESGSADTVDRDSGEADAGDPLNQDEFVAAVAEVCADVTAETRKLVMDAESADTDQTPEESADEFIEHWKKAEAIFVNALGNLRKITPPEGKGDDYTEFLDANERLIEMSGEAVSSYAEDPDFVVSEEDMREQQELTVRQEKLIDSLGIPEDCFDGA